MKILITGGAGCIGIQVAKILKEFKYDFKVFDLGEQIERNKIFLKGFQTYSGSILDTNSIIEASEDCTHVIHLAAFLGVRRTEDNKLKCLDVNINGTKNILEAICRNKKIKKIIFASSSEVYGEPLTNPISENAITQGKTIYAISKLAGEEYIKSYCEKYPHLKYTILRYFNTYGPGQVAQFVIPKFIKMVQENQTPIINGDGKQMRSYCYSKDTAEATILSTISNKTNGRVLNIGNSEEKISIIELAQRIIKISRKDLKLNVNNFFYDRKPNREINVRYCSSDLAYKLLKFKPKISLNKGLKLVYLSQTPHDDWCHQKNDDTNFYNMDD